MNKIALVFVAAIFAVSIVGCDNGRNQQPVSASGVHKAETKVETNARGHTVEQENIVERLKRDNQPGSIKHLYIISAYSGQVIIYSTVKGKVTSGGKRLTPTTVNGSGSDVSYTIPVEIGGRQRYTTEVLQDDGTYGHSVDYLYWFDTRDIYHQHYVSGGQIVHISDQPLAVKSVIINMELSKRADPADEGSKK